MTNTILGLFRGAGSEDPLADLRSLELWVQQQPANDFLGLQQSVVRVLEDMGANHSKVTPNRARAVLELDRLSIPLQTRLMNQYLLPSLSDQVRQRLWHAGDDLARWFAYVYEHLYDGLQELFLSQRAKTQLPGIASRMFYYRGSQAKQGLLRYERWIPGRWSMLHAAFEATEKRGLAGAPFSFSATPTPAESYSAEEEYLQILLLQRLNTGNLTAAQIDLAALWLRSWIHGLKLEPAPLEGPGFWLDLGQGGGLLVRKPERPLGTLLYLDVALLLKRIADGMVELSVELRRTGAQPIAAEAGQRLQLLTRLEQMWQVSTKLTPRRGERIASNRQVTVALGLPEIATALRVKESELVIVGRDSARPASGIADTAAQRGQDDESVPHGSDGWRMRDTSDSGCRLVSPSRETRPQQLGGLIAIQEHGDTRWKIGIIRRLKKFPGGQNELGVEVIAQHSLLVEPKPVTTSDSGYSVDGVNIRFESRSFNALYLPPSHVEGHSRKRTMVMSAAEYREQRRCLMEYADTSYTIKLTAPIERTRDWVWASFEIGCQAN